MRSDLIRVTRPAWVRIVNPEPFTLLYRTYQYGERLLIRPGGLFRFLHQDGFMALAAYEAPHPPIDDMDCPSLALLFRTISDFRLLADGKIEDEKDPYDLPLTNAFVPEPAPQPVRLSQKARVPKTRIVRAVPPTGVKLKRAGGPYREQDEATFVTRYSQRTQIRPGGVLTAVELRGSWLRVLYVGDRAFKGEQCETGSWFWMSEAEFHRMERRYLELRRLEESERQEIMRLLRSL